MKYKLKKRIKNNYKFFKTNLGVIILLPTIIGGFWQLIELSSISISSIRFFSISQLVADGLLILFILSIIFLSIRFGLFLMKKRITKKATKVEPRSIWNGIILSVFSVASFFILLWPLLKEIKKNQIIKVHEIAIIIPVLIFIVGAFIVGVYRILSSIAKRKSDFLNKLFKKFQKNVILAELSSYVTTIIIMFIFLLAVKFLLIDLNPFAVNFRKYILIPDDLMNKNILDKKIKCEFKLKSNPELIYFNDKYFFYNVMSNKNEKKYS